MQVESIMVEIPFKTEPTVEYFETELKKHNVNPLRWAIVSIDDNKYKVSVANLKE